MTHRGFSRKTDANSLFQLPIGLGLPIMLTQVLGQRNINRPSVE